MFEEDGLQRTVDVHDWRPTQMGLSPPGVAIDPILPVCATKAQAVGGARFARATLQLAANSCAGRTAAPPGFSWKTIAVRRKEKLYWNAANLRLPRVEMEKSLDRKLARILADRSCSDFILADAKDADMAFGLAAPGRSPEHHAQEGRFRSLDEYRQLIRENVRQGLLDIMLISASNNELLTIGERLFDDSAMTPAVRANDSSDIWAAQGGVYLARALEAVPLRLDRPGDVRQAPLRAARTAPRRQPRPVLDHLQQRPRPGPLHAGGVSGVPRRGCGQELPPLPRSLRSQCACNRPFRTWRVLSTT